MKSESAVNAQRSSAESTAKQPGMQSTMKHGSMSGNDMALTSMRGSILRTAIDLTEGSRNKTYGPPEVNLSCQQALWEIYYHFAQEAGHSKGHEAAMQHIFAKIARIACGPVGHMDNYIDGAAYFAIAAECDQLGVLTDGPDQERV